MVDIPFAVSIGCGALLIGSVGYRPVYYFCTAVFGAVALAMLPAADLTRPAPASRVRTQGADAPAANWPADRRRVPCEAVAAKPRTPSSPSLGGG
jgi:hypothetical protein